MFAREGLTVIANEHLKECKLFECETNVSIFDEDTVSCQVDHDPDFLVARGRRPRLSLLEGSLAHGSQDDIQVARRTTDGADHGQRVAPCEGNVPGQLVSQCVGYFAQFEATLASLTLTQPDVKGEPVSFAIAWLWRDSWHNPSLCLPVIDSNHVTFCFGK